MVKINIKNHKSEWERYSEETKVGFYFVLAHFLAKPNGFVFRDDFKSAYIKSLETIKMEPISDASINGKISQLSQFPLFGHENRIYGFQEDNEL